MNIRKLELFSGAMALALTFGTNVLADVPIDPAREQRNIKTLKSDAPFYNKAMACQDLAKIATDKSVSELGDLLCDKSSNGYIRYAIARVDSPKVDEALRLALDKCQDRMTKIGIINSIGVRRDAKASAKLAELALDPKSGVAPQALAALGNILDKTSIETLLKSLGCKCQTLRWAGAEASIDAAGRLTALKRNGDAIRLYEGIAAADIPEHMRTSALFGEILAKEKEGIPLLIKNLKGENQDRRNAALRAAYYIESPDTAKILASEIGELYPDTQVALIKAFALRKNKASLDSIRKLTASTNARVATAAFQALGIIGDVSVAPLLVDTATSSSKYSEVAMGSLLILKGKGVDEAILSAAKKADPGIKAKLVGLLADREAAIDLDEFFAFADDKDAKVQKAALRAVGILAPASSINRVITLLNKNTDAATRNGAEAAVVAVARKMPKLSDQTSVIAKALANENKAVTRCSLVRILARIGGTDSFKILKGLIADADGDVADAAVRAVCSWRDPEAIDTLYGIVEKDAGSAHRILAARQYVSLVNADTGISLSAKAAKLSALFSLAKDVQAKKAILIGMDSVAHPLIFKILAENIGDPELGEYAQGSALQIGGKLSSAIPGSVNSVVEKIVKAPASAELGQQAKALQKALAQPCDFITAWKVSPNYRQAGCPPSTLFNIRFAPEMGDCVDWNILPARTDPQNVWLMEPGKIYPGDNSVAYFSTWIYSQENRKGIFEFGSDDGIKAWLNGKVIHANNVARGTVPGADKAKADIEKGWNRLMLKITQNVGPWTFCARLCDEAGATMKNIKVDCMHDEGFTPLFDGKTFKGFEGDLKMFRIEDGAIVAGTMKHQIPHNYFLATTREYGDFELRFQVKTSAPNINAGVQFRSKRIPNNPEVSGYQGDVAPGYWGGLYDESRRGHFLFPLNQEVQKTVRNQDWNNYVIRCEGNRVRIFLNGMQSVDYVEKDKRFMWKTGIIAFQIHGWQTGQAWYRNIKIKEL